MAKVDLTGMTFNCLQVLRFDHQDESTRLNYWECRCDCGNIVVVRGRFLRRGVTKNCGCGTTRITPPSIINVGQKVRFDPFKEITGFASEDSRGKTVKGTVVMVNEPHQWFSVECDCGGLKQRTSFKFYQIGRDVLICGH